MLPSVLVGSFSFLSLFYMLARSRTLAYRTQAEIAAALDSDFRRAVRVAAAFGL